MDHLEMTETLREKAGVSYEEAREALERNNWDLLGAIVDLEKQGRVQREKKEEGTVENTQRVQAESGRASENLEKVGTLIGRLVEKGNRNRLDVRRGETRLFSIPLTVLALVAILAFWVIFPGMFIGWLFGLRYSLEGPDMRSSREYQAPQASAQSGS